MQDTSKPVLINLYLYRKSQDGRMNSGQVSEVNSEGTSFSAFSRNGAAAILMGISSSDMGRSGRFFTSSPTEVAFLEEEQERKIIIKSRLMRCFNGYIFIQKTKIMFQMVYKKFLCRFQEKVS
jgi:hypothetical protein